MTVVSHTQNRPLTAQLVSLTRRKTIRAEDRRLAALFALDAMANAVAGQRSLPGELLLRWAEGTGLDAGRQAFLIGALTHIIEVDDLHRASVVHPGCVVVPAAFVVAKRQQKGGRDLLDAVLHGYEAACRVGMAVGPAHYRIWHNTATCGPFGSAMAVAHLLGLDDEATVHALGNAGSQSSGLWEFLQTGAMTKHLHAGRAAESGVLAADLASVGFTGPPRILEGCKGFFVAACPDAEPDEVLRDPDAPWQLTQTSIKPWPCCRHTHPAIHAALSLRESLREREVVDGQVGIYQAAMDVCDRSAPTTEYEAKFSLQHTVAIALQSGDVGLRSFGPEARQHASALRDRIGVQLSQEIDARYPVAWGAEVTLKLSDGQILRAHSSHAKGDPESPLSEEELVKKAEGLLRYGGVSDPVPFIESMLAMASGGPVPALPIPDGRTPGRGVAQAGA